MARTVFDHHKHIAIEAHPDGCCQNCGGHTDTVGPLAGMIQLQHLGFHNQWCLPCRRAFAVGRSVQMILLKEMHVCG